MTNFSGWGRINPQPHRSISLSAPQHAAHEIRNAPLPGLAYGMGRSYGDVAMNPGGTLWLTRGLDRFLDFDPDTGLLRCEAGVLLRDIQSQFVPQGWMLPVTPGTEWVTIGGAIANDVHGKNHHRVGSFAHHIKRLSLTRTDGTVIQCGPQENTEWFSATAGGLGLTGLITEATLQLKPIPGPWLDTETIPFIELAEFFTLSTQSEEDWEYTVSWIDCLSFRESGKRLQGIFFRGNHSNHQAPYSLKKPLTVPFTPPISGINALSLKPFNAAYYQLNKFNAGKGRSHYRPFFYPLDNLREWNRIYGPKGFYQYQSVVPMDQGLEATSSMLTAIARSGQGSFLAVLKTLGSIPSLGMLSFPQPGVTLALDFPNRGESTLQLFNKLDAIVREYGGRIYPAKDARMPRDLFEQGYPLHRQFVPFRDPGIESAFALRTMGSPAQSFV